MKPAALSPAQALGAKQTPQATRNSDITIPQYNSIDEPDRETRTLTFLDESDPYLDQKAHAKLHQPLNTPAPLHGDSQMYSSEATKNCTPVPQHHTIDLVMNKQLKPVPDKKETQKHRGRLMKERYSNQPGKSLSIDRSPAANKKISSTLNINTR